MLPYEATQNRQLTMITIMLYGNPNFSCKEAHANCKAQRKEKASRPEECHVITQKVATNNDQGFQEHVWMHSGVYLRSTQKINRTRFI